MKIIGIIPARGGSKGVPRKNIKDLCGKPLIQYTIDAAIKSGVLEDIMVSTEDEEIARISKNLGAEVPFFRPKELANDDSPTIDTIIHVLNEYRSLGKKFDACCLLQPTTPLRSIEMIRWGVEVFKKNRPDSLISVRKVPHEFNPHWTFEKQPDESFLKIATGENNIISRRQDLPVAYYRDGSVYLTKTEVILDQKSLYGKNISFIETDGIPYVNIDLPNDWERAEKLLIGT